MMKKIILVILLAFVYLGLAAQINLKGKIVDANGRPMQNVLVVFKNPASQKAYEGKTDSLGIYDIKAYPGTYELEISFPEYKTLKGSLTVDDNMDETENPIAMKRLPVNHVEEKKSDYRIRGTVISDGKELEFAVVRAFMADSSYVGGCATNELGQFEMGLPESGKYHLLVTALGYQPQTLKLTITTPVNELPAILLEKETKMLAEVTVKGQSMTRVGNFLQIIPDKMSVKHASTGYQLLRNLMLPGMDVDPFEGKVSLFDNKVSLYINGEPADERLVQNLRPKDIEKIEYHDAPVGRYSMDFAAINFITKQQTTGGYATLDAQQCVGPYLNGRYNGFAKINKGKSTYYLFAGYNMQNAAADTEEKIESFNLNSRSIDRIFNSTGGRNRNYGEYGQISYNYSGGGSYSSLSAGLSGSHSVETSSGKTVYSEPVNIKQDTRSRTSNTGLSPHLSYYGQYNVRGNDLILATLNASYSRSKYGHLYAADDNDVVADTRDKMWNLSAQLMYQFDLKHRNTLTLSLMDFFKVASTDYLGTYSSWQHMWNSQALFLCEYTHRLTDKFRLTLRPGISMVNMRIHGYRQQNYYFPRFFTQLTYNPTRRQQLNFSLAIGNSTPGLSSRTAAEQPIDLIMYRRGNPGLKDVKEYNADVNYSLQLGKVNINSLLRLNYMADILSTAYLPENDKLVLIYYNGIYKSIGFAPRATWKITDSFRAEIGGSYYYVKRFNPMEEKQHNSVTGMFSLLYFWRDFSVNLKGNTASRVMGMDYSYGHTPANLQLSLSWTHRNWRVDAWTTTLSRQSVRRTLDVAPYRMNLTSHGRFYGMVKVAYTFDFGKKVQREQRQADTSIESAILK